jgi:hypothetical protein
MTSGTAPEKKLINTGLSEINLTFGLSDDIMSIVFLY